MLHCVRFTFNAVGRGGDPGGGGDLGGHDPPSPLLG